MKNEIKLVTIFGIEIGLSFSWFFIFFLISFLLIFAIIPAQFPEFGMLTNIIVGGVTSVLFFISLITHELMHSIVAKINGLNVKKITLFIFGGASQLSDEPDKPGIELKIAIVGPATSIMIAALFFLLWRMLVFVKAPTVLWAPFVWLWQINLILAVFNMLPGFPLDGGRVLRSALWSFLKDVKKATRFASVAGQTFAGLLILFGIFVFVLGQIGGLWFILIGWFLYQAAISSYHQLLAHESLKGVIVAQVMTTNILSVSPDTSLQRLMDEFIIQYGFKRLPVTRDGALLGVVGLTDLNKVPRETWEATTVDKILHPLSTDIKVKPGDDALKALMKMSEIDIGQLLVVSDSDRLVGIVTRRDILKQMRIRQELAQVMGGK